ncbi:MAG: hypothetical protein ACT4P0_04575 [Panacagrimonas sp.]
MSDMNLLRLPQLRQKIRMGHHQSSFAESAGLDLPGIASVEETWPEKYVVQARKACMDSLHTAAKQIGLEPVTAYVPARSSESEIEKKKRKHREQMREARKQEEASGFKQVNLRRIPADLVDEVQSLVQSFVETRSVGSNATNAPAGSEARPGVRPRRLLKSLPFTLALGLVIGFVMGITM